MKKNRDPNKNAKKNEDISPETFATVVIGAGPAGLIFSLINRICLDHRNISSSKWPLFLLEKRTRYVRNHRLQLDKSEFVRVQKRLNSLHFDKFVQFLENTNYRPVINELETFLTQALNKFGVSQTICDVGNSFRQSSLHDVRAKLPHSFSQENKPWVIVGADSVKSTVSKMLGNDKGRITGTHEYLIRLKLIGNHLPKSINIIENFKLSKVLSSVLSYRFNKNGFAEMDLFLDPSEYYAVSWLNANPKNPINLTKEVLDQLNAPFFKQVIISFIESHSKVSLQQIQLQSSFKLEHSINRSRVRHLNEFNAYAFLVGDAAISLPFQRGMTAMIKCTYELSEVLFSIFDQLTLNESTYQLEQCKSIANHYQVQSELIAKEEIKIVSSRASLVRGLRQFIRINAMLPFPIQSWLLGYESNFSAKSINITHFLLNLLFACCASLSMGAALLLMLNNKEFWSPLTFIIIGFVLQFIGGFIYRANFTFTNQVHIFIKRIWQIQIVSWMLLGIGIILFKIIEISSLIGALLATAWWTGGVFFGIGLVLFDQLGRYWLQEGKL